MAGTSTTSSTSKAGARDAPGLKTARLVDDGEASAAEATGIVLLRLEGVLPDRTRRYWVRHMLQVCIL